MSSDELAAAGYLSGTALTHPRYSDFTDPRNWNDVGVIVLDAPAAGEIEGGVERETDKIAALYASFMNEDRANSLGAEPIAADLERALAVASIEELIALVAELERQGLGGFYGMGVDNDPGDPNRYIVFVMQGGIGLPDESYYSDEQFAEIRERYQAHIARMLQLVGFAKGEATHFAALTFDLESRIAASHWDRVASRDIQKLYNLRSSAELQELTPTLNWAAYLEAAGAPESAFAEVVGGLSEQQADFEARRCLSCGNCFECDGCLGSCPEDAIIKLGKGHRYRFDYEKCTGCATCYDQCPAHAIEMIAEK